MNSNLEPQLLDSTAFRNALARELSTACHQVIIVSAYFTRGACTWLSQLLQPDIEVKIIARWQLLDLLQGASDLATYTVSKRYGWELRIDQRQHAKMWLLDGSVLFIGSSNATSRGLGLTDRHNIEFGVRLDARPSDVSIFRGLLESSILVTEELFARMSSYVEEAARTVGVQPSVEWPAEIDEVLQKDSRKRFVWVSECFHTNGHWLGGELAKLQRQDRDITHDLSLLGLLGVRDLNSIDKTQWRTRVVNSKIYRWLESKLYEMPDRSCYFGELSEALHNVLADDPTPYRRTVKILLANLLGWIEIVGGTSIRVDKPMRSQRVILVSNGG